MGTETLVTETTVVGTERAAPAAASESDGSLSRVAPIAPARYKVQFTADAEIYEQLRLAQDMLRHRIPDGDVGRIIGRGLAALLRELARQKFAAAERPRLSKEEAGEARRARAAADERAAPERHIPAAVKREVWLRDGGRCAFVASNGRRCGKRDFLEFHHVVPCAMGGEAAVPNIQLRCRAHHLCEADLDFGPGTIVRPVRLG